MKKDKTVRNAEPINSPGPWKASNVDPKGDPNGKIVVCCTGDDETGGYDVAVIPLNTRGVRYRQANATLIAAAPDMLEALLFALDRIETLVDAGEATPLDKMCMRHVQRAIAKADYSR